MNALSIAGCCTTNRMRCCAWLGSYGNLCSLIRPYLPFSHGVARMDDRKILSGIIDVIKTAFNRRMPPSPYGQCKTLYNRFIRWRRLGIFNKIAMVLSVHWAYPLHEISEHHVNEFVRGHLHVNGIESFWSFVNTCLCRLRGIRKSSLDWH
ncbi:transposase [Akkermansia glycaniphila]|uniref:transposase n=1 Tax=Akkermansia glycaniphila TaxID=1679444 RepID=UPI0031C2E941|nr:transposase [Akkermansia glycaniphila]